MKIEGGLDSLNKVRIMTKKGTKIIKNKEHWNFSKEIHTFLKVN